RGWMQCIHDHDGEREGEGGLALWLRLAEGVGLDREEVASFGSVLPGVRFACDAYVQLVEGVSLVEAVASSLTESVAPDLMSRRIAAWEKHYPWVRADVLEYFRTRVTRARRDSGMALEFVCRNATTYQLQERCVAALIRKTEILWHLLDCLLPGSAAAPDGTRPAPLYRRTRNAPPVPTRAFDVLGASDVVCA